ncbi:NAD(P)H-binding protein [Acinetobacter rathckeae]|uniref:NAD(P)H-binding protein n=1 Tax=Acinetobacter rathckeae TaxID=2605272 RepID=UPI0018A3292A|nr:NAD(P)H-binding protein [Acinetobacter rathckeae]MBF7686645.1 NAD(P)H-binding protein [Acinetobacter rathckeae]MBF7696462.1 NAD(P)H-binding protein [Acinetobacter rathckeae]
MHILFIGYGKTSQRVAKHLFAQGHQITALSRTEKTGVPHLCQDIAQIDLSQLDPIDCVYILLSPQQRSIESYKDTYLNSAEAIIQALGQHPIQRCIVVSSTRVYNGHVGGVVNDDTPVATNDVQGQILHGMEQAYAQAFTTRCVIVRPSGIYGASVERMLKLAKNTTQYEQLHWTNRIHIDDLARFLATLATLETLKSHYIVSDSKPYPLHEVLMWFQKQCGLPLLKYKATAETGKKIYATNLQALGFDLEYPNCFDVYLKQLVINKKASDD